MKKLENLITNLFSVYAYILLGSVDISSIEFTR